MMQGPSSVTDPLYRNACLGAAALRRMLRADNDGTGLNDELAAFELGGPLGHR